MKGSRRLLGVLLGLLLALAALAGCREFPSLAPLRDAPAAGLAVPGPGAGDFPSF